MIKKSRRERYKVRDDVVEATGVEPMGKGPLYASLSRTAD